MRMTAADWGWSALAVIVGGFVGSILGVVAVALYEGLWILALFALPLLIGQLLLEGVIRGAVALWRRWRGIEPEPERPPETSNAPWLRRHGLTIGLAAGLIYGLFATLQTFG